MTHRFISILIFALPCITLNFGCKENVSTLQEYKSSYLHEIQDVNGKSIQIDTKYGDLTIESSDRETVSFEVLTTVWAPSNQRGQNMLNNIKVDIAESDYEITASTEVDVEAGAFSWQVGKETYRINLKILVPNNLELNITHKYGDVFVTDMESPMAIDLKYGNANLSNVYGDMVIDLAYVNRCRINQISGDVRANLQNSHLNIKKCDELDLRSVNSQVDVQHANLLTSITKNDDIKVNTLSSFVNKGSYDRIEIDQVDAVDISTQYAQIGIQKINRSARFETGFGEVRLNDIDDDFRQLDLEGRYTDYYLNPAGSYTLDVITEETEVTLEDEMVINEREESENYISLIGAVGNNPEGYIRARFKFGKFQVSRS